MHVYFEEKFYFMYCIVADRYINIVLKFIALYSFAKLFNEIISCIIYVMYDIYYNYVYSTKISLLQLFFPFIVPI